VMNVSILFASQYLSSQAVISGLEVPSMVEYMEEVSQARNPSCVKGREDPAPKQAPSRECRDLSPLLLYD
jgi:hypothetical protein